MPRPHPEDPVSPWAFLRWALLGLGLLAVVARPSAHSAEPVSFAKQVQPVLEARCVECHSGPEAEWGLELTSYATAMRGSDYGPVIEPGSPDESILIQLILGGDMPLEGEPVTPDELAILEEWIRQGATDN